MEGRTYLVEGEEEVDDLTVACGVLDYGGVLVRGIGL